MIKKCISNFWVIIAITILCSCPTNKNTYCVNSKSDFGNTGGNLVNFGYVVYDNKFLYFANSFDNNKLYKYEFSTKKLEKLIDDSVMALNLSDNWLYFCNRSDDDSIYKVDINGNNKCKIFDESCYYLNLKDDDLYFNILADDQSVYTMKKDGKGIKKISDDEAEYITLDENSMYYTDWSSNGQLVCLNLKTLTKEPLKVYGTDQLILYTDQLISYNGYIYFKAGNLYRYSLKERKVEEIVPKIIERYNIIDDKVYFSPQKEDRVYSYDLKNNSIEKVLDKKVNWIFDINDYIGFVNEMDVNDKGLLLINKKSGEKIILTDAVKIIK